ncbi:MAG TPA: polysaccharide biosynthesis tyrosine autokinase [Xanthomonadaceae bacterium]|jgi:tyrosine-protein kinase Etk/Wzc
MTLPTTNTAAPANEDEIDLSALVGTLLDRKWLIAIVTGVFLVVSVAYAILAAPVYEADGLIQVEQKVPDLPGLSDLTETLGASSSEASTEIALITSRTNIGGAMSAYNMGISIYPHQFPLVGGYLARSYVTGTPNSLAPTWFGISRDGWGGDTLKISQLDVPDSLLTKTMLVVAGDNGDYTLYAPSWFFPTGTVLVKGHVGEPAKANGVTILVKTLVAHPGMRFDVVRDTDLDAINLLQTEIVAAETQTDSGIIALSYDDYDPALAANFMQRLMQLYVKQNIDFNAEEAAKSLAFVRQQIPVVKTELDRSTAALNKYQESAGSVDITMQTKGLLDQDVAVETSIQQLRQQQADIERKYTPNHPAYQALMQQIAQLQAQKGGIEKQVGKLPDTQQELLRLTRDVTVSNTTYTSLLSQAQQLDIARAGTVGNVRIIDNATVDTINPVKPKKPLVIIGGTLLGGILAIGYIFLAQMLRKGVEDPADIEKIGLPVYASIPASAREKAITVHGKDRHADGRQHMLVISAPEDVATEALRSLRTSLHFARLEAKNNILMISGPSPNAGKTFISANLGAAVAQSGQKVLLIDGDLRLGTMHDVIGGKAEGGLSELISGQIDMAQAVRQVANTENLFFVARGKVPPNPSELLMNPRFTALLEKLKATFDMIIIDTPPILAVTDAAIIGSHAGTCMMVVRFGLNQAREIALAKQRFEQNGVEVKGAIFNAVERRHGGYSSYGYYDYAKTGY